MSGPDWYRWYPSKWLAGTVGLTNEQRGVYIQIINVIYDRGACPVDETYLKSLCNCHLRVLRRVIRELLTLGKIEQVGQNYEQTRAKLERKEAETFIKTQRNRALKRWQNNGLGHANGGNANHNHSKKEQEYSTSNGASFRSDGSSLAPDAQHQRAQPNGSAGIVDLDAALFKFGVTILGEKSRSLIAKLKKLKGTEEALHVIERARTRENPLSYVTKVCAGIRDHQQAEESWGLYS